MSQSLITRLVPDQKNLFSLLQRKWLNVIKQPIQEEKAKEIIQKVYRYWEYAIPEIVIVDSPNAAYQTLQQKNKSKVSLGLQLYNLIDERIQQKLQEQIQAKITRKLREEIEDQLRNPLWKQLHDQFWLPLENRLKKQFGKKKPKISFDLTQLSYAGYFEFAQQIGVNFSKKEYEIYQQFFENISFYLAFENLAIIIERPTEINWNQVGKLQAEGKAAIKFRDGYSVYAYDGILLPSKYGRLPLNKWASNWLTNNEDSELIPYIEKWQQICFSSERINSKQAIQAAKELYKLMDYPEPEILLFDSPNAVIQKMDREEKFSEDIGKSLASEVRKKFWDVFLSSLQNQLDGIWFQLGDEICNYPYQLKEFWLKSNSKICKFPYFMQSSKICEFLETQMNFIWTYEEEDYEECDEEEEEDCDEELSLPLKDSSDPMSIDWDEILARHATMFSPKDNNRMHAVGDCNIVTGSFVRLSEIDFCISELKCTIDLQKWNAFKKLMTHCGSVWFYENTCIICDRPTKISFDNRGRLHGEDSPAIQFADGFSVYAFQNVRLSEKYGKVHPSQWKSQWLLEGNPANITKILIENIGYERINRELNEYSLTPQDIYELLRTNLHDKVDLSNNVPSSQEPARNYINIKSLPSYEFEVVTVNFKGEIIAKEKKQAQVFTEDLGNNVSLEMVAIPGGEFLMGTADSDGEENPQHLVKVSPFFLSKYPITQAQWRAIASLPKVRLDLDLEPSHFQGGTRPVENITKQETIEFCARLWQYTGRLYSLPTEAQWEYACRANTTTPFHFGETITTDLANYNGEYSYEDEPSGNFRQKTLTIGSFPPNAFGLYDMHGNVFEFCADNWHNDYQNASKDGKSRIGGNDEYAPIRGGGWKSNVFRCRSANRNDDFRRSDIKYSDIGFRVIYIPNIDV